MTDDPPAVAVARFVGFIRDHPEWPDDEPGFLAVWWLYNLLELNRDEIER